MQHGTAWDNRAGERVLNDRAYVRQSPVERVVEGAARRRTLVLTVEHSAIAVAAMFAGCVLLLLVGTQILNWPWLVLLGLGGAGITLFKVRRRALTRYGVAQVVDRRSGLSDALSTAWFLLHQPQLDAEPFARAQIGIAESAAERVDAAAVFPFVWRRTWGLAATLGVLAFGLFAVRYLVTDGLSFKRGLIPPNALLPHGVLERLKNPADKALEAKQKGAGGDRASRTAERSKLEENAAQEEKSREAATAPTPLAGSQQGAQKAGSPLDDVAKQGESSRDGENTEDRPGGDDPDGAPPTGAQSGALPKNARSDKKESGEDANRQPPSSLTHRMKDALSGLLDKMRPQENGQKREGQERSEQDSQAGSPKAGDSARRSQAEQSTQNSKEDQGKGQDGAESQAQAQASEKTPGTQSRSSDQSADRKGSDAQSGIGRQDGEKSLKEAEQLRAMGKLDEIIGKRSASLTGDMTVETRSSHQELRTQYSGRVGHHANLGGEIERDEVPPSLQRYVREYMEQVRKQADAKP